MSIRLPCICNLKSISVLSGCLSMSDAISLHHCLQNHHQYCIILSWIRALNINRPIVNLVLSFAYYKTKYFGRLYKSTKSTYFRWIATDWYKFYMHSVTCFHTFFVDFLVHTVKLKPIIKVEISAKLVTNDKWCSHRFSTLRENPFEEDYYDNYYY